MTTIYAAQWVLPVTTEMIDDGAVAVAGERIAGVGPRSELRSRFPHAEIRDYGEAAIIPGLVNCHTHLELTVMRGYLEPEESDFFAWLKKLTLTRMLHLTEDDIYVSALWGAVEAARAGVTTVGDASSSAVESMRALRETGLRGTVYQETFGPDPAVAGEQFEKLRERVGRLKGLESELVRVGVSPHAPYTVSAPLFELIADYAAHESLPLMIHAAESEAEWQLIREGRGLFARNFSERGIPWRSPGVSPVQYLKDCGVLRAHTLLAHCIRVDERDVETIRESGAAVAHCPKSNAKLGHGHAPYHLFKDLVHGFGSDSVASNNTCDLLEEARFAALASRIAKHSADESETLGARDALRVATQGGAHALGLDAGTLAEGRPADLAIVRLDGAHQTPVHDPERALVFASSGRDVVLTVIAGREVYRDGRVTTVDEERLRARVKEIARKLRAVGGVSNINC
ncbi:MAG: amidohydrolase family protein [Pyrinomonadaceae bacterium]